MKPLPAWKMESWSVFMNKLTLVPGSWIPVFNMLLLILDVDPEPDPHHHHPPRHHPSSSFISYSTASFLPFAFILHLGSLPSSSSVPVVPSLLLCNVYHRSVWPLLPSLIQSRWISPSLHVSVAQWCCWIWLSFPHTLSDCVVHGWWTYICHYTPLLHQSWGICAFLMHPQSPAALEWTLDWLLDGGIQKSVFLSALRLIPHPMITVAQPFQPKMHLCTERLNSCACEWMRQGSHHLGDKPLETKNGKTLITYHPNYIHYIPSKLNL